MADTEYSAEWPGETTKPGTLCWAKGGSQEHWTDPERPVVFSKDWPGRGWAPLGWNVQEMYAQEKLPALMKLMTPEETEIWREFQAVRMLMHSMR